MAAVTELANDVGTSAACQALCMPRASYYRERRKTSSPAVTASRPSPARALHPVERAAVLSRLHEERFQDRSPAAVYATLLDEGELSLLDSHHVSLARSARRGARAPRSVDASALPEARADGHRSQSALELGYN